MLNAHHAKLKGKPGKVKLMSIREMPAAPQEIQQRVHEDEVKFNHEACYVQEQPNPPAPSYEPISDMDQVL